MADFEGIFTHKTGFVTKASGTTRSDLGRDCRDAFFGLAKTCANRVLGLSRRKARYPAPIGNPLLPKSSGADAPSTNFYNKIGHKQTCIGVPAIGEIPSQTFILSRDMFSYCSEPDPVGGVALAIAFPAETNPVVM